MEQEKKLENTEDKTHEVKKYPVDFLFDPDVATLLYLATVYKLDIGLLLLLYSYLKEDIFLIFLLFSGKQINFPEGNKLFKFMADGRKIHKEITTGSLADSAYNVKTSLKIKEIIRKMYSAENNTISFEVEVNERIIK